MKILQQFVHLGPNRCSDVPVAEIEIVIGNETHGRLTNADQNLLATANALIHALAPGTGQQFLASPSLPTTTVARFAWLYSQIGIFLQRCAGHLVSETGMIPHQDPSVCHLFFEYEEPATAAGAIELCTRMLEWLLQPGASPAHQESDLEELKSCYQSFLERAAPLAMPADTRMLMVAAAQRDIPCFRLDRKPFEPIQNEFRVRPNALLALGQGCHRHIVDGTFCVYVSEVLHPLVRNRERLLEHLATIGIPIPARDRECRNCNMVTRATRAASRLGYPVVLKSAVRQKGVGVFVHLADATALAEAARTSFALCRRVIVEKHIVGEAYRIVAANGKLLAVLPGAWRAGLPETSGLARPFSQAAGNRISDLDSLHPSTLGLLQQILESLPVGLMEISLVTPDLARPLEAVGGAIVDVELVPELGHLSDYDPDLLRRAMDGFLDWLFPGAAPARIPVVAVTGTNGKTSTCRMIDRIMSRAGHTTGLTCTDGLYIGGEKTADEDLAGLPGHLEVLNSVCVTMAVLECARGGAVQMGLGFDYCNVAVCLNVTEDHIGEYGIDSLEDMAAVKQGILARARKAVVLNSDNRPCHDMRDAFPGRRICLASLHASLDTLKAGNEGIDCFILVEQQDGEAWIVLHDRERSIPVLPVAAIPATHRGTARHYISNAQHAIAACHLMDVPLETIRDALLGFSTTFDSTPGRLNIHHGKHFLVIMDFAHNPDGVRELCAFLDNFPCRGRRLIALASPATRGDAFIRATAVQAAGHFDHYICKNFTLLYDRAPHEVPTLLQEGLLSAGVAPERITVIEDELEAVQKTLEMAREDDLLVILSGKVQRETIWQSITGFEDN